MVFQEPAKLWYNWTIPILQIRNPRAQGKKVE